ncbi:MAG: MFS transporter, partial [Pseudomonadota bacterium]|nr:MFS transporter [Pseudomonadota bacterium]
LGRFFWASVSDHIGRKNTYYCFFLIGIVLYCAMPTLGHLGLAALFVVAVCAILSMYGGGFATVPAYLADMFGTQMVGAIHGRLLTAWSAAGILGPVLIANVRQFQLDSGVPKNLVYDRTLYILAAMLAVGFICNLLIKPVDPKNFMTDAELAAERGLQHEAVGGGMGNASAAARGAFGVGGVLAWLAVGIPFLIGVWIALAKAAALF